MAIHGPHPIPKLVERAINNGAPYFYAAKDFDQSNGHTVIRAAIAPERIDQLEAEADVSQLSEKHDGVRLCHGQWFVDDPKLVVSYGR